MVIFHSYVSLPEGKLFFFGLGTSPIPFFRGNDSPIDVYGSKGDHPKANIPDAYNLNMYSCIIYIYDA